MKMRYLALISMLGLALTGCATEPEAFSQVDTSTVHFLVPKLQLLPKRTSQAQQQGGLVVSVEAIPFGAGAGYREDLELQGLTTSNFVQGLMPKVTPDGTPERFYTETRAPVATLSPGQLSFQVSITNNTQNTLKIDPRIVVFVDSREVVVPSSGFSMSLAPGTHQVSTLTGPDNSQIFQGNESGTVILSLLGIHTDPFDPAKTASFKWDYTYSLSNVDKSMPVMRRTVELSELQAQHLNGTVTAQ
jgi:hypothetical protein